MQKTLIIYQDLLTRLNVKLTLSEQIIFCWFISLAKSKNVASINITTDYVINALPILQLTNIRVRQIIKKFVSYGVITLNYTTKSNEKVYYFTDNFIELVKKNIGGIF